MSEPLKPFTGVSWAPEEVMEWAINLPDDEEVSTRSRGQWMVVRRYAGGPVEFWLHICDMPRKDPA